jgi:hypothetical protein
MCPKQMFPYKPPLCQYINIQGVGDIRQPWVDLGKGCGVSDFAAKALFTLGLMRRYILSANAVLRIMDYRGFLSAYGLLSSGIELLGRCVHEDIDCRQHPTSKSRKRLEAGLEYIKRPHLRAGVIVETNHYPEASDGYSVNDLVNLRNLVIHGACIAEASQIKSDIELLHELRRAFYGTPSGEKDPHVAGEGPLKGALDRYYDELASGNQVMCDRLADAAISPGPLQFQGGDWPLNVQIIHEIREHIESNLEAKRLPIIGGYTEEEDSFQLYR